MQKRRCLLVLAIALIEPTWGLSQEAGAKPGEPIVMREALVVEPVAKYGRVPVYVDYLVADLVSGKWQAPKEGDAIQIPGGAKRTWKKQVADKNGLFSGPALMGGYAYWQVDADSEKVMLLEAQGHSMVYVNGEPRAGDAYSHGYVKLPVLLKKGKNDFLFHAARGKLQARLLPVKEQAFLNAADMLQPDFRSSEVRPGGVDVSVGAIVVINASKSPAKGLDIVVEGKQLARCATSLPELPPLSVRKLQFSILDPLTKEPHKHDATVALQRFPFVKDAQETIDTVKVQIAVRGDNDNFKRTFISKIDGSIQYYAVCPAVHSKTKSPALVLSLHGASVEATGQAAAYGAKSWAHIVAPTNRRPFGFDWEDWGRMDAMEVLEHAQKELGTDPQRTYLTGHSMGGHGVWHLGATFPDRFAAIGPSAGWATFWTYGGKKWDDKDALYPLIDRASNPSDTFALARNYLHHGVYILHGDADDNVPVSQARTMRKLLDPFHRDMQYFEQPKAGHWWDAHPEPGTDCVDWAPMFDFFARRVIPWTEAVREIEFVTMNPGISARSHWIAIEAQLKPLQPSSVKVKLDPGQRQIAGTTRNVARLAIDLKPLAPGKPLHVELDEQKIKDITWPEKESYVWLERKGDKWALAAKPPAATKGPHRYGPFREAFNHNVCFVYGTKGTPEENAWAYAKARFDAETFWYQGNASIEMIADTAFEAQATKNRSVIVYGNADTNAAWPALLGKSPVQVYRDHVRAGAKKIAGKDLACVFVQPRPGSDVASVGVVSGTGLQGAKLTDRLKFFVSGAAMPDFMLYGPELPTSGYSGVLGAGYFGLDWGVESGEFLWRDDKKQ